MSTPKIITFAAYPESVRQIVYIKKSYPSRTTTTNVLRDLLVKEFTYLRAKEMLADDQERARKLPTPKPNGK